MKKPLFFIFLSIICSISIFKAECQSNLKYINRKKAAQSVGLICLLQVKYFMDLVGENPLTGRIAQEFNHSEITESLEVLEHIFPLEILETKNTHGLMSPLSASVYQQLMHKECSFSGGNDISRQEALRVCDIAVLLSERVEQALASDSLIACQVAHGKMLKRFLSTLLDHSCDCFISAYIR